jgi:Ca-activated chloride channel homolog
MPTLSPAVTAPLTSASCGSVVTADGRTLPLRTTRLVVHAAGGIAQVRLVQTFANPWAEPLHVTYRLPLPADAAVGGFGFRLGDRQITGEIDRRTAARERFERAIASGRTAALLEQDRSSLFTQELGNLPPGAELVATIEIDQPLLWVDDGWQWRFPTTAAPRYLGAEGRVSDAGSQQIDVHDPNALALPARCELELVVADELLGGSLPRSPSHALHATPLTRGSQVGFAADGGRVAMDRDVVVHWPAAAPAVGLQLRTSRSDREALAGQAFGFLMITPPIVASRPNALRRDLIVLLDTSGSMSGAPLAQAQQITGELIRSLGDGDQLELIAFSSRPEAWRGRPQPATPSNRAAALQWLQGLRASGGTEMHTAILQALAAVRSDAQRQIVLVTDGLIGFEREVVGAIRASLPGQARVHVVGVGSAPNRTLTRGASRAGRGLEILLGLGEPVGPAVLRLLARTAAPIVDSLEITGTAVAAIAPQALPDLFAEAPARIALQLHANGGTLLVRGRTAVGTFVQELTVAPITIASDGVLARGFAREVAEDLEVELAAGGEQPAVDARLERVGLLHGIATRMTSWIAVMNEATVDPQSPSRRDVVPHELPHGMAVDQLGLRPCAAPQAMPAGYAVAEECKTLSTPMAPAPTEAPAKKRMQRERADEAEIRDESGVAPPSPPKAPKSKGGFLGRMFGGGGAKKDADDGKLRDSHADHGGGPGAGVHAKLRARTATEWVFELSGIRDWAAPARVTVVFADGSEVELVVDSARTTAAATMAARALVRLVLLVKAGSPATAPVRLRLQLGAVTLDVPVA